MCVFFGGEMRLIRISMWDGTIAAEDESQVSGSEQKQRIRINRADFCGERSCSSRSVPLPGWTDKLSHSLRLTYQSHLRKSPVCDILLLFLLTLPVRLFAVERS